MICGIKAGGVRRTVSASWDVRIAPRIKLDAKDKEYMLSGAGCSVLSKEHVPCALGNARSECLSAVRDIETARTHGTVSELGSCAACVSGDLKPICGHVTVRPR